MKFARSLTRNMPKYLIVFFGLLLVFNVFAFFLTPGLKEGHTGKNKKKVNRKLKNLRKDVNSNQKINRGLKDKLDLITSKKGGEN